MKKELAVVLASGGMDSAVTVAMANQNYRLAMLHLNYGQRTEKRELRAFIEVAEFYRAEKTLVVNVEHLKQIGGSSLTDAKIEVARADLSTLGIRSSYVPFRNANLLSIATSWAEVLGATDIFVGAVEEDGS
ncbi:MAG TPA: 7-cyano-7-deazaguanine synthase, partial [bacterium]